MYTKFDKSTLEYIGEIDTLDLEIDSTDHNYYANNICVSNSHSVSYSYVAMQTLFLKHYYPTEFYCALLNHPKTSSDKDKEARWLSSALMAAMSKGIEIVQPNRKSNLEWTIIDDKKIAMGYSSINGLGEVAYKELKSKSIENMTRDEFFAAGWSKFNKKSFEVCLKAGLFDDWSNSREHLLEMKTMKIKDENQIDLFTQQTGMASKFAIVNSTKKFKTTTEEEKYADFLEVCSLDLYTLKKINELKAKFKEEMDEDIDSVTNFEDPNKFYYFSIVKVKPEVSKKGTKYYSILIGDGATTKKVNMWSQMYDKLKEVINEGSFYVTKFEKKNGFLSFNATSKFRRVS